MHDCECIIHRIFTGRLQSDVRCTACNYVSTTIDPFWDLSLGIRYKQIRSKVLTKARCLLFPSIDENTGWCLTPVPLVPNLRSPMPKAPHETITLLDCLETFTHPELLGEDALIVCQNCGARRQAMKRVSAVPCTESKPVSYSTVSKTPSVCRSDSQQLTLRSLPVVLCFHLKRFKQDMQDGTVHKVDTFVRYGSAEALENVFTLHLNTTKRFFLSSLPPSSTVKFPCFLLSCQLPGGG